MLLHVELLLGEDADVDEFLELLQRFHLFCDAHGGGVRGRCRACSGGCRIGTARAFGCKCGLRLRLLRLAGVSELYCKQRRDAIIIWCIQNGRDLPATDDELYRMGEDTLVPKD